MACAVGSRNRAVSPFERPTGSKRGSVAGRWGRDGHSRRVNRPHARRTTRINLLIAGADADVRSHLAWLAAGAVAALDVLEAEDGAEVVQIGLQRRPQLALLDVNMPRLGGIEVALTLRDLQPQIISPFGQSIRSRSSCGYRIASATPRNAVPCASRWRRGSTRPWRPFAVRPRVASKR
jgi:CheY-like chemotaxis protein